MTKLAENDPALLLRVCFPLPPPRSLVASQFAHHGCAHPTRSPARVHCTPRSCGRGACSLSRRCARRLCLAPAVSRPFFRHVASRAPLCRAMVGRGTALELLPAAARVVGRQLASRVSRRALRCVTRSSVAADRAVVRCAVSTSRASGSGTFLAAISHFFFRSPVSAHLQMLFFFACFVLVLRVQNVAGFNFAVGLVVIEVLLSALALLTPLTPMELVLEASAEQTRLHIEISRLRAAILKSMPPAASNPPPVPEEPSEEHEPAAEEGEQADDRAPAPKKRASKK
jgi:hypothetical protein